MQSKLARSGRILAFFALFGSVVGQVYYPTCAQNCIENITQGSCAADDRTCLCLSTVHRFLPDCACFSCSASDIEAINIATDFVCPGTFNTTVTCPNLPSTTQSAGVSSTTSSSPASTSGPASSETTSSKGLSTGAKAGIGAGVGGGAIVIAIVAFFFWRRGRSSPHNATTLSDQKPVSSDQDFEHRKAELVAETKQPIPPSYAANELESAKTKGSEHNPKVTELGGGRESGPRYAEMTTLGNSHEKPTMQGNSHELGTGSGRSDEQGPVRKFAELPSDRFD